MMAGFLGSMRLRLHRKASTAADAETATSPRAMLVPLVLAQFLASYDTSSMNVAIGNIVEDLDTTVTGVQTAITLFTLTMAALMIPGSKLTDIWGRRRCFRLGLAVYATGAFITALSPGLGAMIFGWSLLEGIGSALMIPPIYIIVTVSIPKMSDRAKAFGVVSAAAGLGSASGPLIGGCGRQPGEPCERNAERAAVVQVDPHRVVVEAHVSRQSVHSMRSGWSRGCR